MRWMLGLLLSTLLIGSGTGSAVAQEPTSPAATPTAAVALPTFAIFPKETGPRSFFQVTQNAGTTERYTVVLLNTGEKDTPSFAGRAYAANVYIRINGGLDSGQPDEEKTGATAWFDYPTDVITLEPGTGIERTFEVTVPTETKPGQYIAALSFETADPIEVPGTPNLKQTLRQTIAFMITVPGAVEPAFSIENLHLVADEAWSGLEATIVNTGNVLVKPAGKLTVSDLNGNPLMTQDVVLGTYYAFKSGLIQTGTVSQLPAGEYLITLELRDSETGATALIENQKIATVTQSELAQQSLPPVNFTEATKTFKPDVKSPQFLDVSAVVGNSGDPVENTELNIAAYRDDELVENYVLVSPLALPTGETRISSRYIPADGWSSGTWSFTLSVQVRDLETGVATVLSTAKLGEPIAIP